MKKLTRKNIVRVIKNEKYSVTKEEIVAYKKRWKDFKKIKACRITIDKRIVELLVRELAQLIDESGTLTNKLEVNIDKNGTVELSVLNPSNGKMAILINGDSLFHNSNSLFTDILSNYHNIPGLPRNR